MLLLLRTVLAVLFVVVVRRLIAIDDAISHVVQIDMVCLPIYKRRRKLYVCHVCRVLICAG